MLTHKATTVTVENFSFKFSFFIESVEKKKVVLVCIVDDFLCAVSKQLRMWKWDEEEGDGTQKWERFKWWNILGYCDENRKETRVEIFGVYGKINILFFCSLFRSRQRRSWANTKFSHKTVLILAGFLRDLGFFFFRMNSDATSEINCAKLIRKL